MQRISVVTPYFKESTEMLMQCHQSVSSQIVDAEVTHHFVADGHPNYEIDDWGVQHTVLSRANDNNGNTPRAIGAIIAENQGYDFVAFLDADNWYHPDHLSSLLQLHRETTASICCSFRTFHQEDGALLNVTEPDEDSLRHVDTSCFLVHRSAFALNTIWARMPNSISPLCDRVFFSGIRHMRFGVAFSKRRTVAFRTTYPYHYKKAGLIPPVNDKEKRIQESIRYLMTAEGVRETVEKLGYWP